MLTRILKTLVLSSLLPLLSFAPALAQTGDDRDSDAVGSKGGVTLPLLTLERAIQIALENNLGLRIKREDLPLAQAALIQAGIIENPRIEFERLASGQVKVDGLREADKDGFGVSVGQEIPFWGKRGLRKKVARTNMDRVRWETRDTEKRLIAEVRRGFYTVQFFQDRVAFADSVVVINRRLAEVAEARVKVGDLPEFEANLVRVRLQTAMMAKVEIQSRLMVSKIELNTLLGRSAETKFTPEGELTYRPLRLNLERLRAFAIAHRPDLKSLQAGGEMADAKFSLERREVLPDIELAFRYDREEAQTGGSDEVEERFTGGFTLPLSFFNRNQAGIKEAMVERRRTDVQIENALALIDKEVALVVSQLNTVERRLELFHRGILELVERNLEQIRTAYQVGETGLLEVLAAEEQFVEARTEYLEALYEYNVGWVDLERAIGGQISDIR